jgi:uncharacterized protein YjbI with pentapeptide repeats
MTNRTLAQMLADHANRHNGGRRLVWSELTSAEQALFWRANLRGANLYGADMRGANLNGADLNGADLYGASLRGADLNGANLYRAKLHKAYLYGAKLTPGLVCFQGPTSSDGYDFILFVCPMGHTVISGCHNMTLPEYEAHIAANYEGTERADETRAILAYLQNRLDAQIAKWSKQ